jgi:hypothetical protein
MVVEIERAQVVLGDFVFGGHGAGTKARYPRWAGMERADLSEELAFAIHERTAKLHPIS